MSLFTIDWGIEPEYKEMLSDILKYLTIIFVAYTSHDFSSKNNFMTESFFDIVIYLLIGLIAYHLIIKKAIIIV